MTSRLCFFARVAAREILERVEFYAQDIQILKDIGYDVHIATRPSELIAADVYYAWWWTWAFAPLAAARLRRRPIVVTGVFDLYNYDLRPAYQRWLMALPLPRADANVFLSHMEFTETAARFRVRNPSYCPCAVDTEAYRPAERAGREPFVDRKL